MRRPETRVLNYLLARQKRAARIEAFGQAMDANILERRPIGENEQYGTVWTLSPEAAASFSGDAEQDRQVLDELLKRSSRTRWRFEQHAPEGLQEPEGEPWAIPIRQTGCSGASDERSCQSALSLSGSTTEMRTRQQATLRDYVLSLVSSFAAAPKVTEIATALLLARAIDRNQHSLVRLLEIMRSRTSIFALQFPVKDFERHFGQLFELGLVMPFFVSFEPIAEGRSLTGRYQPLADSLRRRSFFCLSGAQLKSYDDDELRDVVSKKILTAHKPLIICDESNRTLRARLVAVADIVLRGGGIDKSLIGDVLSICFDIPTGYSSLVMQELGFDPDHLGLDDLATAMRPGRSLETIVSILAELEAENAAQAEAKGEDEKSAKDRRSRSSRSRGTKLSEMSGHFDVIEPVEAGAGQKTDDEREASREKHLFVEHLMGYGEAKHWAIDLKLDLEALWNKEVSWADLSTRLLLSGPPGTGKTTFARALGNTLQVPLIATSVARWLEPSNLGDVLRAISTTFEHARSNAPCILFIDEVDNIGSRGNVSGDSRDDYWASLVNRLLELLDGAARTEGVVILGATNRPEKIDPALLRSGRLEKHIVIPRPDTDALVGIIAHHLGGDLDAILTSRDVGTLCDQARKVRTNG